MQVVTAFGALGGAERWLLDLLDHAHPGPRWEAVVLQDGPLVAQLVDRDLTPEVLPTGASWLDALRSVARLAARWRRARPDVVLANGVKAAAVAVPAARLAGVPVAWAKHDFARDGRLARPLGRASHRVIAVSPEVGEATGRDDVVLAPPTVGAPPAPVDEARDFWRAHGIDAEPGHVLAMVARLVPIKAIDDAIRALADPAVADWRLVVVGGDDPSAPDHRRDLEDLARSLGVADRVEMAGFVPDAGRWLAAFDAVAVLTRPVGEFGREGFGLTALEALRAGVPVIAASGNPAAERLARAGGEVVTAGDTTALVQALVRTADRNEDGSRQRRVAEGHPDVDEVCGRVIDVLRELAGPAPAEVTA